ncbi:MAG: hypothetical protein ACRDK7_06005 [Solirubrobacteraceae bacterium]
MGDPRRTIDLDIKLDGDSVSSENSNHPGDLLQELSRPPAC